MWEHAKNLPEGKSWGDTGLSTGGSYLGVRPVGYREHGGGRTVHRGPG